MVKRHLHYNKSNKFMLMRNLVSQLFTHQQIATTLPKAKEAQKFADKLITKGKRGTEVSNKLAESFLIVRTAAVYKYIAHLLVVFFHTKSIQCTHE